MNERGTNEQSTDATSPVDISEREKAREASEVDAAPTPRIRIRVRGNPKPEQVVGYAIGLIRERGKPMTRREIWNALSDIGVVVNGADPVKALGTMLWRSGKDLLVQLEGHGYWIKDEPYGPAAYLTEAF